MIKRTRKVRQLFLVTVLMMLLILLGGCNSPTSKTGSDVQKAPARDYILIGIPTPSTGPIASFGVGTPWTEERALETINKDGGIFIKELNKKLPVKIKVVDTESNPTKAAEVTSKLILEDKVDMLIARHTPDVVNPVTSMAERYGIPTISVDCPTEAWLEGGPYKWSYHSFWKIDTVANQFEAMWANKETNKTVGLLLANDLDGSAWAKVLNEKLPAKGYKVVDPGRFPVNTKDFSAIINEFKKNNVEIVTGTNIPPDFATFLKQSHQLGYVPKIITSGKAYLFEADAESFGNDLAVGLTNEVWWSPYHPFKSSLTGETAKELVDAWMKESGKIWNQPIGLKYAGMEIAADVLMRAQTLDKEKIRIAIGETNMDTIVGPIKYNEDHYCETPVVGGQWAKGSDGTLELQIINNQIYPQIPITAEMIFPLPK